MKKFLSLLLVFTMLFAIVSMSGCNSSTTTDKKDTGKTVGKDDSGKADSSLADIKKKGELVMYTNAAFPPFEYTEGDKVVGVDVDIATEIAKQLGVKLTVKNVEFDTILPSIDSGKGDIGVAGISITPEREKQIDFSDKYVTSMQYIIIKDDASIKTIENLKGKRIGVQTGTTGDIIISEEAGDNGVLKDSATNVMQYNNAIDASMALKAGKIDAVVIDELPAMNIAKVNTGLKALKLVYADGKDTKDEYAIVVKKGNTELLSEINKVLGKLKADGTIEKSIIKHTSEATA